MKLHREAKDKDLYVSKRKMTEKERKELAAFIEEERRKKKAKKHRKAA